MMKQYKEFTPHTPIMVIGAAIGDCALHITELPRGGEDVRATDGDKQIGGCAFNVARVLRRLNVPVINAIPVGNDAWGEAVAIEMQALGMEILIRHPTQDNGWCLALIKPDGEPTFISVAGCESDWNEEIIAALPIPSDTFIYISGYELAGKHSHVLHKWLLALPESNTFLIDFGVRLPFIDKNFINKLLKKSLMLTLSPSEVSLLCGIGDPVTLCEVFAKTHHLTIILHIDHQNTWLIRPEAKPHHQLGYPATIVDTIGKNDTHCGGILAGLSSNWDLEAALDLGNRIAAIVMSQSGAQGAPDWQQLKATYEG